ncbi:MAG: DUF922 domain-containing protein [Pseudomonadota bacterium]
MQNKLGRLTAAACFGLTLTFAASPVQSKVILKERVTFYDVRGNNGREIYRSMVKNGPSAGRKLGDVLATLEVDIETTNVEFTVNKNRCIPSDVDVLVRAKFTYPRWKKTSAASKATRRAWRDFFAMVKWHENQHLKIALDYAKEYEESFLKTKFRRDGDCNLNSLAFKMRMAPSDIILERRNRQFDRKDLRPGGRGYEAQLKLFNAK